MIITNVTLYKTPLDNTYSNIFDIEFMGDEGDYKSVYKEVIDTYDKIEVPLSRTMKALKLDNKITQLTLYYNYFDIKDYTYVNISGYWFFINSLLSQNDNINSPSVTVEIEWDAWANNIDKFNRDIKNKIYGDINTRHVKRFDENLNPIYYKNTENELPIIENEIKKDKKILFAKLTLNEKALDNFLNSVPTLTPTVKEYKTETGFSFLSVSQDNYSTEQLPFINNRIVVYTPLALISDNKIVNGYVSKDTSSLLYVSKESDIINTIGARVTFKNNVGGENELINLPLNTPFGNIGPDLLDYDYSFIGEDTSFIENIEYTFLSPYDYIINGNIVTFKSPVITLPFFNTIRSDFSLLFFYAPLVTKVKYDNTDTEYDLWLVKESFLKNGIFEDYSYIYNDENPIIVDDNILNYYNLSSDPKLNIYPFNYVKLLLGNENIIISPNKFNDNEYILRIYFDTNQPRYSLLCNGEIIRNCKTPFINNSGGVTYGIRAFDEYMINNGSQKTMANALETISNITDLVSPVSKKQMKKTPGKAILGKVESVTNLISTPLKQYALEQDLKRKPTSYIKSNYGEDDLIYQDRPVFIKCECKDINYLDVIKRDLYLHGYAINKNDKVFINTRIWFDFIQTDNIDIDIPLNSDDKKIINEIHNNGVYRYHINVLPNGNLIVDTELRKDASLNNIERSIANVGI